MAQDGRPCELKVYGRGKTFDSLARKYGLGIPTRAVLDELIRAGSIELLPNQKVRAKTSTPVERDMSVSAIKSFGDRATELLSTMLLNMQRPERQILLLTCLRHQSDVVRLQYFRESFRLKFRLFWPIFTESRRTGRLVATTGSRQMGRWVAITESRRTGRWAATTGSRRTAKWAAITGSRRTGRLAATELTHGYLPSGPK